MTNDEKLLGLLGNISTSLENIEHYYKSVSDCGKEFWQIPVLNRMLEIAERIATSLENINERLDDLQ